MKEERQQPESLVVSVPLSANTVPGIQLPTNSSNNNTSNSPSVSTIVNTSQVQMQTSTPSVSVSSSSSIPSHGSLYQHLTNNQSGNNLRASPHVQQQQQQHQGRSSPITPTMSSINDGHSSSNHTSVLQNMNSVPGVISTGFHGSNLNTNTTTESNSTIHKANYEKQPPASRLHALQQEECTRRSRYVHETLIEIIFHFPH